MSGIPSMAAIPNGFDFQLLVSLFWLHVMKKYSLAVQKGITRQLKADNITNEYKRNGMRGGKIAFILA